MTSPGGGARPPGEPLRAAAARSRRRALGWCLAAGTALLAAAADVRPRMLLLDAAVVGTDVVAVGERGTMLRSVDNARTWQPLPRVVRATLTAVAFAGEGATPPPTHGWSVGHDALILGTTDGGRTWARQFQGENQQDSLLDVLAIDAQHVIAVGAYGLYLETKDSGKTWARRKLGDDDFHFNRVTRGPAGTLYLAGERGTLLRSADLGSNWTRVTAPYEGSFYGVLPLDGRTLLAHGLRGKVFRSADDGASWKPIETPQPVLLATAVKLRSNFLLLAGYAGTLLLSRDYGQTLAALESPTKAIAQLLELPDGSVLALGEEGATVIPAPK